MSGDASAGWGPDLQDEIQDAEKPEAGRHGCWERQEAGLTPLLGEGGALPSWAVPPPNKEPTPPAVLVVPVPGLDSGAPIQEVSRVEGAIEDPVGGGVEGDWQVEEPVDDPGPTGRWAMQSGGAGLPDATDVGRRVLAEEDAESEEPEWELRERRERREREEAREAEAEELGAAGELGAGEAIPLFLPTPSFMASADEE